MTVKELRTALQSYPDDTTVMRHSGPMSVQRDDPIEPIVIFDGLANWEPPTYRYRTKEVFGGPEHTFPVVIIS